MGWASIMKICRRFPFSNLGMVSGDLGPTSLVFRASTCDSNAGKIRKTRERKSPAGAIIGKDKAESGGKESARAVLGKQRTEESHTLENPTPREIERQTRGKRHEGEATVSTMVEATSPKWPPVQP